MQGCGRGEADGRRATDGHAMTCDDDDNGDECRTALQRPVPVRADRHGHDDAAHNDAPTRIPRWGRLDDIDVEREGTHDT